jgi:hypothetical protein
MNRHKLSVIWRKPRFTDTFYQFLAHFEAKTDNLLVQGYVDERKVTKTISFWAIFVKN